MKWRAYGFLLVLGAVLNVAIAWTFMLRFDWVLRGSSLQVKRVSTTGEVVDWVAHYRRSDATISNVSHHGDGYGITLECISSVQPWRKSTAAMLTASRCSVGWPMRSLSGGFWKLFEFKEGDAMARSVDTISVDSIKLGQSTGSFLPLRPLWSGFLINTLFYTAIIWLLFFAPLAVRRRLRIKRGQCPACAYPVGISNICTECGRAVAHVRPSSISP